MVEIDVSHNGNGGWRVTENGVEIGGDVKQTPAVQAARARAKEIASGGGTAMVIVRHRDGRARATWKYGAGSQVEQERTALTGDATQPQDGGLLADGVGSAL